MAESLGELIVKISADVSDLKEGLLDAQNKVKETSDKIGDSLEKIGLGFTAMGAAITGAFTVMIKSSVDYSEQLIKLSQRTGIAVETLSQLKYAGEQVGVSIDELANGLKFLERNAFNAENGNSKLALAFRDLGISLRDTNGNLKDGNTLLLEMADRFQKMPDGPQKTALAMQLMGRAGVNMITILNQGSDGIKEMDQRSNELGGTVDKLTAKTFKQFGDDVKDMNTALGGLTRTIALEILPAIDSFIKFVTNIIVSIREWEQEHPKLSAFINQAALALGVFLTVVGTAILSIKAFAFAFGPLGAAFTNLLNELPNIRKSILLFLGNPITWLVGAVALLAIAWANNWLHIREVTERIARLIGQALDAINEKVMFTVIFFQNAWNNLSKNITHPIDAIKKAMQDAGSSIDAFKKIGGENLGNDFAKGIQTASKATDKFLSYLKSLLPVYHDVSRASNDLDKQVATNSQNEMNWFQKIWKAWSDAANGAQDLVSKTINGTIGALATLEQALQGAATQNKAFAEAAKVLAIGMAIINTAQGVTKALADYPFPYDLVVAGIVGAAGAIQIGTIASQGFSEGTDSVPSMLTPGETVIPQSFAGALRAGDLTIGGPGGAGGGDHYQINVNVKADVNSTIDIDKMASQIGLRIEQKLRRIR